MIYINSQKANIEFFPDGTVRIKKCDKCVTK